MKKYAYIGCIGFLGVITTEFCVIGILPQIASHYNISIDKAGILLSAFALVIALTGPFMTLLTSGFERKKVMLVTMIIFLITGVVSFFSPPFWLLLIVRVLPAFLQPVYIATALSVAVSKGNKSNENELMGIVFSGVAIAMVTTVPFATYMASILSWQYSFMIQALVSFAAIIIIYIGLPEMPVLKKKSYASQIMILKEPIFIVSTLMNFFMIAGWFSTYSYFAEYLNKAKGMDETMVSIMLFVFGLVGVIANWAAGKMLNRNITGTVSFFLSGTLLIPVLLYFSNDTIVTVGIIVLWGFLYSPSFFNASTYMISAAPKSMEFANSLATSFGNLGVTLGTTAGGIIIANKGVENVPWLMSVFGSLSFCMIFLRIMLSKKDQK